LLLAKSGYNIRVSSSIYRQLSTQSDQGIHRPNDGELLLVQSANLQSERLRREGGELKGIHDDDLTADREG
jgi:hypothetical protein